MPTYDFRCTSCEAVFEVRRRFGEDIDSASCPDDGAAATRLFSPPLDMLVYGREPPTPTSSIRPPGDAPSGPPHDHGHGRSHGQGHSHGHGHPHGPGTPPHSH